MLSNCVYLINPSKSFVPKGNRVLKKHGIILQGIEGTEQQLRC